MCRLEFYQLGDIRLVLERTRVLPILHKTVSSQSLKRHLHELHGILVIHLVEEELLHLEQLISLDLFDLLFSANVCQLLDRLWELQVAEGVHSVEDAFRLNILLLMGGLRIDFFLLLLHISFFDKFIYKI